MQECFLLNNQQHIGLQKLSALSGTSHSFLGPMKQYKFIQDETSGESTLVCSCLRVIESLELACAVSHLVRESLQAHHRVYHTGCGCLLFLAGAWSRAALGCLQKGVSVPHVISAMSEGIDVCMDVFSTCAIPTESIRSASAADLLPSQEPKFVNTSERRKLKLSRHFFESQSLSVTQRSQAHATKAGILRIAQGLSHGCDDTMKLAVEAFQILSENNQTHNRPSMFDVSKVVTCLLPGLPAHRSCVVQGCVVLLSAEQSAVAHRLKDQKLKVALITGDLSHSYRHLGFNRPQGFQRVGDCVTVSTKEEEWIQAVVSLLMNLEVNLILLSGRTCEKVTQQCCRRHILVVEKLKMSVLKTFAHSSGAIPVVYPTQLGKDCIGTGVRVTLWRGLSSSESSCTAAFNICGGGKSRLVTAILTGCVYGRAQAMEDQFWACAYRLHHALKDGRLLPGAGQTETLCIRHLLKRARSESHSVRPSKRNPYTDTVLQLMADGLMDYTSTVMMNSGKLSKVTARTVVSQHLQSYSQLPYTTGGVTQPVLQAGTDDDSEKPKPQEMVDIYDNLSVKQEAWRKALDLVFLVLQTDAEIVTGVGRGTETEHQHLIHL